MEIIQIILVSVVFILTLILFVIGFEVFLVFGEFRQSIRKINKILDDMGVISESIAKPISGFSDLTSGMRFLVDLVKSFAGGGKKENKKEEETEETIKEIKNPEEKGGSSPVRRFFLRAGKKLS